MLVTAIGAIVYYDLCIGRYASSEECEDKRITGVLFEVRQDGATAQIAAPKGEGGT